MMMPNMLAARLGGGEPMQPQPYPVPRPVMPPPMQGQMPPNSAAPIMQGQFGMQPGGITATPYMGGQMQPAMPQPQMPVQAPMMPQNNLRMMMGAR